MAASPSATQRALASPFGWLRWSGVGVLLLAAINAGPGCAIRTILIGRTNTGTCDGACDRYQECSAAPSPTPRYQCLAECPDALGQANSIREFESLECEDVVRFVDGPRARVRDE
jgi:hypothetical protein